MEKELLKLILPEGLLVIPEQTAHPLSPSPTHPFDRSDVKDCLTHQGQM